MIHRHPDSPYVNTLTFRYEKELRKYLAGFNSYWGYRPSLYIQILNTFRAERDKFFWNDMTSDAIGRLRVKGRHNDIYEAIVSVGLGIMEITGLNEDGDLLFKMPDVLHDTIDSIEQSAHAPAPGSC